MKLNEITCISDLYYVYGRSVTIIAILGAFITLPFALEVWPSVFSFLMCSAIAFVGCAAHYKDKFDYPIHYASACISGICSIIWTIHTEPWFLLFYVIAFISLIDKKRWLLYCELPCFIMVYTTLLIYYIN